MAPAASASPAWGIAARSSRCPRRPAWTQRPRRTIRRRKLAPLFAEIAEAPRLDRLLVFGAGEKIAPLPPPLAELLRAAGLRVEAMATGPAARVYKSCSARTVASPRVLLAAP